MTILTTYPATRAEAKKLGITKYQSDTPCPHGHSGLRYTRNSACCDCTRGQQAAARSAKRKAAQRERRARAAVSIADLDRIPASAEEADEVGARFYITGNPCKRGHIALRAVHNRECMECRKYLQKNEHLRKSRDTRDPELPDRIAAAKWLHRQCLAIAGRIPTPHDTNLLFDDYPRSGWTLRTIKRLRAETKRPRRKGGWER